MSLEVCFVCVRAYVCVSVCAYMQDLNNNSVTFQVLPLIRQNNEVAAAN